MVVDTSALVAIVLAEDERPVFEDLILRMPVVVISTVSVVETTIVLSGRRRNYDIRKLDEAIEWLRIDVRGVDRNQGLLAREAFLRYGRGRSPARLNFGDCFPYALARAREDTLLFKGGDFLKTDIVPAWLP